MWKLLGVRWKRQWNLHYGYDFCELNCLCKYIMSFEIELSDSNKNLHSIVFIIYNYKMWLLFKLPDKKYESNVL